MLRIIIILFVFIFNACANDSCKELCPKLNYDICSHGFKPVLKNILENECCPQIQCVSEPDLDNLVLKIDYESQTSRENLDNQKESSSDLNNQKKSSFSSNSNQVDEYIYDFISANQTEGSDDEDYNDQQTYSIESTDKHEIEYDNNNNNKDKNKHTCILNGTIYFEGDHVKVDLCTNCLCENGYLNCKRTKCPDLSNCEVRKTVKGECCQVCTDECLSSNGKVYQSDQAWKEEDDCIECKCERGKKTCVAEMCETAKCKNPIKKSGICCPVCEEKQDKRLDQISIVRMIDFKYPPHCKKKMSTFRCNLTCKHGFVLESQCPICKCWQNEMRECKFPCEKELKYMPLDNRFCKCKYHCDKSNESTQKFCDCNTESLNNCLCNQQCSNSTLNLPVHMQCYDYINNKIIRNNDYWFDGSHYCLCLFGKQFCTINIRDDKSRRFNFYQPPLNKHKNSMIFKKPVVHMYTDNTFISMQNSNKTMNILRCKETRAQTNSNSNKTRIWQLDKCLNCFCKQTILFCEKKHSCNKSKCKLKQLSDFYLLEDEKNENTECCKSSEIDCEDNDETEAVAKKTSNKTYWSCIDSNGNKRLNGKQWLESYCIICRCVNGEKQCLNQTDSCPMADCDDKVYFKDTCCSECLSTFKNRTMFISNNGIELIFPNLYSDINDKYKDFNLTRILTLAVILTILLFILVSIFFISGRCHRIKKKTDKNHFISRKADNFNEEDDNDNLKRDWQEYIRTKRNSSSFNNSATNRTTSIYNDESRETFLYKQNDLTPKSNNPTNDEIVENSNQTQQKLNIYYL